MKRLFLLCILIALTLACPGPAGADEVQTPPAPAGVPYEVSLPGGTAADTTGGRLHPDCSGIRGANPFESDD